MSLLHDLQAVTHMLRSLDVLSNITDENNQSLSGDEHLLRGIHAEAGVCGVWGDYFVQQLHFTVFFLMDATFKT